MEHDAYEPRYTERGHSIKSLKREAKLLQRERQVPLNVAQDLVAQSARYSSWAELASRKANPFRDEFFRDTYARGVQEEATLGLYAAFRAKQNLRDDKESFRMFAVKQWEQYSRLGFHNLRLTQEPLPPKVLRDEMLASLKVSGADGLVPRNLGARLLETFYFFFEVRRGGSEALENEPFVGYEQAVIQAVVLISGYQSAKPQFEISIEELHRRCDDYLLWCVMELVSRRTGVEVKTPSVKDIFQEDASFAFQLPSWMLETM